MKKCYVGGTRPVQVHGFESALIALLVISRRSSSLQKTDGRRNSLDFPATAPLPHSHINLHEDSRPPQVPPTTQSWWPIRTGRASPAIVEVPPVCWISRIRLQRNVSADAPAKYNEWIHDEDYVSPPSPNPDSQRPPAAGQINTAEHGSEYMNLLRGPAISATSAANNAPDDFQDRYLQPLIIFDTVIEKIANICPYAKMALNILSTASKRNIAAGSHSHNDDWICYEGYDPPSPDLHSHEPCAPIQIKTGEHVPRADALSLVEPIVSSSAQGAQMGYSHYQDTSKDEE
ncbi:hypothetical protein DEU56DRAFT_982878 [Suillus clintonianus]|uniref:uncharacterized protein n=1 Tax=Suillus clintonianus TaxID=1904413 RepID=UPI001B861FD5|nr:uncharacterized protein DEU56DRAFT_982878 [Suillus clintonianus]KAG2126845.1 hypothetical protein DEU56DRAFT_982878 [Suillus clintonianus]